MCYFVPFTPSNYLKVVFLKLNEDEYFPVYIMLKDTTVEIDMES